MDSKINPVVGTSISKNCFEIRIAIESKEKQNITDKELTELLKYIPV